MTIKNIVINSQRVLRHYLLILVIVIIGSLITAFAHEWYKSQAWNILSIDFERFSSSYSDLISNMFELRLSELRSIERYYAASQEVERDEFTDYVSDLVKDRTGFLALMWAPIILAEQRQHFEKKISSELGVPYTIRGYAQHSQQDTRKHIVHSSSEQPDTYKKHTVPSIGFYTPVLFAEPYTERNRRALGFNISSEKTRLDTVLRAIKERRPIASERITLIHEGNDPTGFMLIQPIFSHSDKPGRDIQQSEHLPEGIIIGRLSAKKIVQQALKDRPVTDLSISLVERTITGEQQVLVSINDDKKTVPVTENSTLTHIYKIEFAGHHWEVIVSATDDYIAKHLPTGYKLIWLAGLMITLIIAAYIHALRSRHEAAEVAVQLRTSELNSSQAKLKEAQRIAKIGSWELDHSDNSIHWSDEVYRIFEVSPQSFAVNYGSFKGLLPKEDAELLDREFAIHLEERAEYNIVHKIITPNGRTKYVQEHCETQYDKAGSPLLSLGTVQDITERKEAEERIAHLAHHDMLTGLPNRVLFRELFEQTLAHARRTHNKMALIFIDLDHFKFINDTMGHSMGDSLLREVAQRLTDSVRESDILGRHGGDEFLVALADITDMQAVIHVANTIINKLNSSFKLEGQVLGISCSMGITIFPDNADDFEDLLSKADTAMYSAKDAGRGVFRFFSEEMNIDMLERLEIQGKMREDILQQRFFLHYQPQINVKTGDIVGFEALLRWRDSNGKLISPEQFIPVAEDTGQILPLGRIVLKEACQQLAYWHKNGHTKLSMAINLSAVELRQVDLKDAIQQAIDSTSIPPDKLELELTESVLLQDTGKSLEMVRLLKELGVTLAIDDFGTGYSSLSYLKRLNADRLKIDRGFINDLPDDKDSVTITRAIIHMAHELGITVVAEGVEKIEQAEILGSMGCNIAQGYFYSEPKDAEAFTQLLAQN
jgi:diguanylate cyclase (GGDEF)-like protein/PAS domain S-box-containing protein